jgi:hypothetical protein
MKIQNPSASYLVLNQKSLQSQRKTSASETVKPLDWETISQAAASRPVDFGTIAAADPASIEIMSRYDLRNISYTNLVKMAGELRGSGVLQEKDYLDFIGPSPEFASISGDRVPGWNDPQDYVARHEQQLGFMLSTGSEQRFVDFEKHIFSLFQHFYSLQGG